MSDAYDRGWGAGWPNCQTGTIATLTRNDGLRLPIRREIIPLVAWLIDETERRGYDVRPDWTWGYSCRAIRGSSKPSNHSWGLAIDINAPTNPMTSNGQLITDMPSWMPALWADYGFRWGGSYAGSRKDAMHYEFMGTPADAARYIAQITQPPPPKGWLDMLSDDEQKDLKRKIDVLYEQLIGSKDTAGPEVLRQLLREDAADSDAVEKRTRPKKG